MALEIERKFLVRDTDITDTLAGERLTQGYLSHDKNATVRVRIAGDSAWLTIKGKTEGATRSEFEYPVPVEDANAMLNELCGQGVIDKTRYRLPQGDLCWEIDVFHGDNEGLIVAEIELPSEDTTFDRPDWLGEEVTGEVRYYNSALSSTPYKHWTN
ncbi:MAG: CYTH domain-containing protein [Pseudomonadota bacterium]|jgi:adenylate cyclase|uniref:CYTH domain-containing protein n=1 Tax=Alcanivorax sp. TaxID=1872427 RepID=UPI00243DD4BB|nr:CYTH domain-containing protein [Alcanivorax sp.]MED5238071.1 CYTH domain-containing protein [Pseudomonadota bacterium]MEE3321036.1 CYTH domain-containing protein [Pseudomonadota bacterium]